MGNRCHSVHRVIRAAVTVLALFGAGAAMAAEACRADTVMLRGDFGTVRFNIELADEPAEQQQGLMHREMMPISSGMLFVYPAPQPSSFWMRNTLIPLDMIFTDARGVITHIHHNAIPLDETPIFGGNQVLSVLEINGGLAERLGIEVGSQLRHPAYGRFGAAWPC